MSMVSVCCGYPPWMETDICSNPSCRDHSEFYDDEILQIEDLIVNQKYRVISELNIGGHDGDANVEFPVGYVLIFKGREGGDLLFESQDGLKISVWESTFGTEIPQLEEVK